MKELIADKLAIGTHELQARLDGLSGHQRGALVARFAIELGLAEPVCAAALDGRADELLQVLRETCPDSLPDVHRLGILRPLMMSSSAFANADWLSEALRSALAVVRVVPSAHIAVVADGTTFASCIAKMSGASRMLLEEGAVRTDGAPAAPAAVRGFSRSNAERRLYDQLEARPRTRGLFDLNGVLSCEVGRPELEVDLVCRKLRIALEIDGYHHFRDASTYRRDREKDTALQEQGYVVVRVLATDVVADLDFVLSRVHRAMDYREQKRR